MTGFSKVMSVLKTILIAVLTFVLIITLAGFLFFRFYIVPKYNNAAQENNVERSELSSKDFAGFAKYLTDKQFLENLKNFDKSVAQDVLTVMLELENEYKSAENGSSDKHNDSAAAPVTVPDISDVPDSQKSAYDRILAAADKDEIAAGLDILSKVDIEKINKLQKEGKIDELKEYIKSVLTPEEISLSLTLYNKYKHLL